MPPDQVFVRSDFEFLLTRGVDLVTDEIEYDKLIALLSRIGEIEFYIRENIGATITERDEPFQRTIKLSDSYNEFQEKVRAFEPQMGWVIHHFFIHGQSENWGINICECPAIQCVKRYSSRNISKVELSSAVFQLWKHIASKYSSGIRSVHSCLMLSMYNHRQNVQGSISFCL